MRKSLLAPIVLVAALLVPTSIGLATASFTQVATVAVTDHHAGAARVGASVGLKVNVVSTDAGALGGKPKAAKLIALAFPSGTRFNLKSSVGRVCRLSDRQIQKAFGPMCPDASEVGTGTALINTNPAGIPLKWIKPPMVATARARAHVYVHSGRSIIVVLYVNTFDYPGVAPLILHGHASGSSLTLDIPRRFLGRQMKSQKFGGVTAVIVSLKLTVTPTGSGAHALIRAGRCERGRFVVTSHFTYVDHSRLAVRSTSRCSR